MVKRCLAAVLLTMALVFVVVGGLGLAWNRTPENGSLTDDLAGWWDFGLETGGPPSDFMHDTDVKFSGEESMKMSIPVVEGFQWPAALGYRFAEPLDLMKKNWILRFALKIPEDVVIGWAFVDLRTEGGVGRVDFIAAEIVEPVAIENGWRLYELTPNQFTPLGNYLPRGITMFDIGLQSATPFTVWIDDVHIEILN